MNTCFYLTEKVKYSMAGLYLLIALLLPLNVAATPSENLFGETLSVLKKGLAFFSSDYSSINVDGLFGLRLGQGQIIQATNICAKKKACSSYLKDLKSLTKNLDETCEKALPYLEESDPDYYKRFIQTISKPYVLPYTPTKFDSILLESLKTGSNSSYNEEAGDRCYARIMGTFKESSGVSVPRCNITHSCYNMMTSLGTSRYAITHQLLYFIVIEHVGCSDEVERFINGKKIFDLEKEFCQKVYKETEDLVVKGQVKSSNRDLFYEQTVLCGSLGFENFFKPEWMSMALRWPDKKDGCIKMNLFQMLEVGAQSAVDELVTDPKAHKVEGELGKELGNGIESELKKLTGRNTMRKLLREKPMKDGCLSHASGLAFGTFGSYLHHLVQQL